MPLALLPVLAIAGVLILVNAFYVAAEFGAVSARRSRIHELAAQGNWLARLLLPVVQDAGALDRYVATCQIGITLSSLILGAYGQATLAVMLRPALVEWGRLQPLVAESTAAAIVLVALTALQVVFGELVPKSLALRHPTSTALHTVLPMRWSRSLLRWFIVVLNGSGVFILRRIGMEPHGHRHVHSPEELELLIAESRDGGLLEADEQRRLHRALRFGLLHARQLMVPRTSMVAVDLEWDDERLLDAVLRTPFSRIPVYERTADRIVGVLHTRDVALAHLGRPARAALRVVVRPPVIVPEMMPASQVLRVLRDQRTHLALVIDEFGTIQGLVTLEDVVAELLGDIGDGFHLPAGQPERLADGRLRLPGHLPLVEAQRRLEATWRSDADTLAGYVMEVLGRMPVEGDQVAVDGIRIEVERLRRRVPETLLVTPRRADATERRDG